VSCFESSSIRSSVIVLVAGLALASCATVSATTTPDAAAPHRQPSDPAAVEILRQEPTRPHQRLGEIVVDASSDPSPSITKIEDKLRTEGGKIGADAVVVVTDKVQPDAPKAQPVAIYEPVEVKLLACSGPWWGPWWGRSLDTVSGRRLVAVAIKYQQ